MIATIIISCIIGACAVAAAVYIIRRKIKNKGKCSGCDGHCYGCTACTSHSKEQSTQDKTDKT